MIVLTRVRMCEERASFVLRMCSLSALMVSLELAQSVEECYLLFFIKYLSFQNCHGWFPPSVFWCLRVLVT